MASFNRQTCHVTIAFLLVVFAIGSSSGHSLLELKKATTKQASTPEHLPGIHQNETSLLVPLSTNIPSPENQLSNSTAETTESERVKKFSNNYRSGDSIFPPTNSTPEYSHQQEILTSQPGSERNASRETEQSDLLLATLTPIPALSDLVQEESIGSKRDGNGIAEDLLIPLPRSIYVLANLIKISIQSLDTAFRGTVRNHQLPILRYGHSFRTTMLQISQKLSNAFLVSSTNADKIKMLCLFVPSRVKDATKFLKKMGNFSEMVDYLYLPLKNLKETTDQTFNLSSQIASQFGELVHLVDEVSKVQNSSKLNNEQRKKNVTTELNLENPKKKTMEREIIVIEKNIRDLKQQQVKEEAEFNIALNSLKLLQAREADESTCYLKYNWYTARKDIWHCPNKPDPSQIQQVDQKAKRAQQNFERTLKLLHEKESEAAKKREDDNELLIRIERLSYEMRQLSEDMQLLNKTTAPLSRLKKNVTEVAEKWKNFAAFCGSIQSGAAKSLEIVEEANRTSTLWSSQLSEKISSNLNETKEDSSLVGTVVDIYLKGTSEHIKEIVAEMEQLVTKTDDPEKHTNALRENCKKVIEKITNKLTKRKELKPQPPNKPQQTEKGIS